MTNCQGERTFSLLGRIKNELRNSMCQTHLSSLSLMSIESDLVRQLDFDDLVDDFEKRKESMKRVGYRKGASFPWDHDPAP